MANCLSSPLGHRLIVERRHKLHDAVDHHHLGLEVVDEQPHVVQQQVEVAATQGIDLQVVVDIGGVETRHLYHVGHNEFDVALFLLGVEIEHAGRLYARDQAKLPAVHPGGQTHLEGRGLAALLLTLESVDVAQRKESHLVNSQRGRLGFHLGGARHAHLGQRLQSFLALQFLVCGLGNGLLHNLLVCIISHHFSLDSF